MVPLDGVDDLHLRDVDVVVLPDLLAAGVPALPRAALRAWVEAGGTLVAVGRAVKGLLQEEDWLAARLVEDLRELSGEEPPPPSEDAAIEPEGRGEVPDEVRPERTPGAVLRLDVDPVHFVGFGVGEEASALVLSDRLLQPGPGSKLVAAYAMDATRRGGFVWPRMEEVLPGQAYVLAERHGKGKVILFSEQPTFRGAWPVTARMLLNAMLLGPSLSR
jgi:hypothetical protein